MVCGEETRANIVRILAKSSAPGTTDSWVDNLYTCTYALTQGSFVLSVQEAADPDAAQAYVRDLQRSTDAAAPIEGLANLGFPAFQTPTSAALVTDNFVLTVDAAALPETLGPNQVTRAAFAYQVATTVLACWSELSYTTGRNRTPGVSGGVFELVGALFRGGKVFLYPSHP